MKLKKMKKGEINIQSSIDNLKSFDAKEMIDAIKKGDFSKEDIQSIREDVNDLMLLACKTKISLNIGDLYKEQPHLPLRDVVVKMLNLLPKEIKEKEISILTNFIMENWKNYTQKKAA